MAPLAVAYNADDAIQLADSFGYPVAVKLLPGTDAATHKKAVGGISLDRYDKDAVLRAFYKIQEDVTAKLGAEAFGGVLVQPMQPRGAIEIVMGILQTEFGPMVLVGEGGSHTEKRDDTVMAVPPFGSAWAKFLLRKLRIYPVLETAGGAVDKVAEMLAQLSDIACCYPQIMEADLNPVCVFKDTVIGVDARIRLSAAGEPLHGAVLRRYPAEYQTSASLRNGAAVTIRPVRLEDRDGLASFARTLSRDTLRLRFGSDVGAADRSVFEQFDTIARADYFWDQHLVAWTHDQIVGLGSLRRARLSRSADSNLALMIGDNWQRQGLGRAMLGQMVGVSGQEGVQHLLARVPAEAQGMLTLLGHSGFRLHRASRTGFFMAERSLS